MDPIIGTIILFAGNFAPTGWAFCDGSLLQISTNSALFSILGTTYGGDGVRTFGLPDLRGRVPLGAGSAPGLTSYPPGASGGTEEVTLLLNQMPVHNHLIAASTSALGNADVPSNAFLANSGSAKVYNAASTSGTTLNPQAVAISGGSQPHENRQPYLAMNYIIALQGIYPTRP